MNEYEQYGQRPEVRQQRDQVRQEFQDMVTRFRETWAWANNALPEGYHGRWENLSLSDLQFLHGVLIDIGGTR